MPASRKRPTPPERMVELLVEAKRGLLRQRDTLTVGDFERAWDEAWRVMVAEHAWPHNTFHRRTWRAAMLEAMKPEACACFIGASTAFQSLAVAVLGGLDEPEDLTSLDVMVAISVA
jgi:hypothetical protein